MNKRILGYINWHHGRKDFLAGGYLEGIVSDLKAKKPDHIAVTGDLVNISLPEEYEHAAAFLKLLGKPQDVTAICGNHDAYVRRSIRRAIRIWNPYLSADKHPMVSTKDYPVLRVRKQVALIACNSAEATAPFFATGYFRKPQAERLSAMLRLAGENGLCRVVFIHHPPFKGATHWHKRLIGADLFQQVIREHGAELVLHGHTHMATRMQISGPDKPVPVICVPAAGQAPGSSRPAARYNLFSIEKRPSEWKIKMQAYGFGDEAGGINLIEEHELA